MTTAKTAITIDPSSFFRDGLESCLLKAGIQPLSHALGLAEVVRDLAGRTPDVAAVGPNFTESDAFTLCRELLSRWPAINIILYTGHAADPLVQIDAFHTGLKAALPREAGEAETVAVLKAIEAGRVIFAEEVHQSQPAYLTARERDVLSEMAEGKSDREIAAALVLSVTTVRNHHQHILEKLLVHEKHEAVRRGWRLGWLPLKQKG